MVQLAGVQVTRAAALAVALLVALPCFGGAPVYEFDGVDDYIDVASFGNYDSLTVSSWVYVAVHDNSKGEGLVTKWDTGTGREWLLDITSSGYAAFVIRDGSDATKSVVDSKLFPVGAWCHVVGVADGSNLLLYIDGVLVAGPTAYNGVIFNRSTNLELGRYNDDTFSLNGRLSSTEIYSNGKTAAEIRGLYKAGGGRNDFGPLSIVLPRADDQSLVFSLDRPVNSASTGDVLAEDAVITSRDAARNYGLAKGGVTVGPAAIATPAP